VREDGARAAAREARRHIRFEQRTALGLGGDLILRRQRRRRVAVGLHVAVHRSEDDVVADGRLQELLAHIDGTADHQVADADRTGVNHAGADRVLDRADAIAFGDREFHQVLTGRQAGSARELQRRRHAAHDRRQARSRGLAVHHPSLGIGNHVSQRHHAR
jgi:hypothetical protein